MSGHLKCLGQGASAALLSFLVLLPAAGNGAVKIELLGKSASGGRPWTALSADGRYVAFQSGDSKLAPGSPAGQANVFVRDRQTGTTELVSVDAVRAPKGGGSTPAISGDGRFVAFAEKGEPFNGEILLWDRQNRKMEQVSVMLNNSAPGQSANGFPAISADGRFIAFESAASDLVPGDANETFDIFVRDRLLGKTELISASPNGTPGNGPSTGPALSADGHVVTFASWASDLIPDDADGLPDLFIADRG